MADRDVILNALTAIRDSGLCTDRNLLNAAWRELIGPTSNKGDPHG